MKGGGRSVPIIYLDKTERDLRIAQAMKKFDSFCEIRESDQRTIVSKAGTIRVGRRQLEEELGGALSDDEWKGLFGRAIGQLARYDEREYLIEEEPPGDF
jgi:hypothetical protein